MMREGPHDAASLRAWKERHGLTSGELAALCDVSLYTVHNWLKGRGWTWCWVRRALRDVGRSRALGEPFLAMTKEGEGSGEAFRAWRQDKGLTIRALSRMLPASVDVLMRMNQGQHRLTIIEARALRDLDRELRRTQPRPPR